MSLQTRKPALRLLLAAAAVLVAAAPASATLGLPEALPTAAERIDTPVSSHEVILGGSGADACNSVYTPALPALPVPPLPVPVPVPSPSAAADSCIHAGTDGVSASASADAAGSHAEAAAGADAPDTEGAQGFLSGLIDALFGWM